MDDIRTPPTVSPAFNPIWVVAKGDELPHLDVSLRIDVFSPDPHGVPSVFWQAVQPLEPWWGVFDISGILKRLFVNHIEVMEQVSGSDGAVYTLSLDLNLCVKYYITFPNVNQPFYALNAVRQLGEESVGDKSTYAFLLTGWSMAGEILINKYNGYPLDVAVLNNYEYGGVLNPLIVIWQPKEGMAKNAEVRQKHFTMAVTDDLQAIGLMDVNDADEYILINQACIPDNPFYLRWINQIGGYDYHMFDKKKEYVFTTNEAENIQRSTPRPHPFVPPNLNAEHNTQFSSSREALNTIVIGEEQLSFMEHSVLSGIPRSPKIEWYNESAKNWQTMLVEDSEVAWDTSTKLGAIELTLIYPRVQMQF